MTPADLAQHVENIRTLYRINPEWQRLERLFNVATDEAAAQALRDMRHLEKMTCEDYIHKNDRVDVVDFDDIRREFTKERETKTIQFRMLLEVNTDQQRRCYNGCHAKTEIVWSAWSDLEQVRPDRIAARLTFWQELNAYAVGERGELNTKKEFRAV